MIQYVIYGILFLIVCIPIAFILSPRPASYIVRKLFETSPAKTRASYPDALNNVDILYNIEYPSAFKNAFIDIICCKNPLPGAPTILWIHGGAFVGGDKQDITDYGVEIAAHGYNFVAMNYERAPESNYPHQLQQITEVYHFLMQHGTHYNLNTQQIILAGDSAGAHMAVQFTMIQYNPEYAHLVGIEPSLDKDCIRAILLFCGPYDFSFAATMKGMLGLLLKQTVWAYTGNKHWETSPSTKPLSLINYISNAFPPTFITDGNSHTFTQSGLDFSAKLKENTIYVDDVFYDLHTEKLPHVYQFDMTRPASVATFNRLITFLKSR